jgi:hypothetical protein
MNKNTQVPSPETQTTNPQPGPRPRLTSPRELSFLAIELARLKGDQTAENHLEAAYLLLVKAKEFLEQQERGVNLSADDIVGVLFELPQSFQQLVSKGTIPSSRTSKPIRTKKAMIQVVKSFYADLAHRLKMENTSDPISLAKERLSLEKELASALKNESLPSNRITEVVEFQKLQRDKIIHAQQNKGSPFTQAEADQLVDRIKSRTARR